MFQIMKNVLKIKQASKLIFRRRTAIIVDAPSSMRDLITDYTSLLKDFIVYGLLS
jgi:hypothetical protein